MKTNEIKKGTKVKLTSPPVTGIMADNLRGIRRTVDVKGSEAGGFDETGSVWAFNILQVEVDGKWQDVEHTPQQLAYKNDVKALWG
tara:strand:- start:79 stop:336 length:258 start_codon:yes stop_codon:yes gene_type:complete